MDRIGTHKSGGQASAPALSATHSGGFHGRIRDVRRQLLLEALAASDGNRTRAGILLGLHHRHDRHDASGLAHDEPELGLAARKRAHRKFDYWWRLLVDAPPAGSRPPDQSFLI
jgi:hypothetical protein